MSHLPEYLLGALFIFTIAAGLLTLLWLRRQNKALPPQVCVWTYVRYHGGGSIQSPRAMTESEAIEFCRSMGAVAYVDREHGFIFYRPHVGG